MTNQLAKQAVVVPQTVMKPGQVSEKLSLFNEAGEPVLALTFEEVPTGADVVMTGYTIAGSAAAVSSSDTANVAVGKVEKRVALLEAHDSTAELVLTGFVTGSDVTALASTDTVNAALAKLQNRIAALETP